MKWAMVMAAVVLSAYALGCDPELSQAIDDVVTTTPGVCEDYCNKKFKCEWYAEGELKDDAKEDGIEACKVNCAWQMNNGAYVVKDQQEGTLWYRKYKDHVSGSKLTKYFECLWDKDLYTCVESEMSDQSWFALDNSTEDTCDDLRKCTKELDNADISKWEWVGGMCTQGVEPTYLLF